MKHQECVTKIQGDKNSTETHLNRNQVLKLSEKDFEVTVITMLNKNVITIKS